MKRLGRLGGGLVALALLAIGTPAVADEEPVIEEVLQILKDRGLVDEARYNELVARNTQYEEEHQGLLGRIEWSGDLRTRLENFWYEDSPLDEDRDDRTRIRYRLRLGAKAAVNEHIDAYFLVGSGDESEHRSTNRTLGDDIDFDYDPFTILQAFIDLKAPESWLGDATSAHLMVGKTKNPFIWKAGKDYMLWDGDIYPEGVGFQLASQPADGLNLFFNSGYYIVDENSTRKDPHVLGFQGGAEVEASETVGLGARLSWYEWRSLDTPFVDRAASQGSIPGGLTGTTPPGTGDGLSTGELAAYVRLAMLEDWPILLYGHVARNFDADDSPLLAAAGEEDLGWGLGLEVGDKKKFVMLGLGYYHLEANFWPAQFTDSDLLDGLTNREGWTVYGARQILPNTELSVSLFVSDAIRESLPTFEDSLALSDRVRLQTDLIVKF